MLSSSNPSKKNSFHRRNDSGELDVFEAARYFSSTDQNPGNYNLNRQQNYNFQRSGTARMSLDLPMKHNPIIENHQHGILLDGEKAMMTMKEKTKYKQQPSSPGGRLANFLNSIFNQAHLRKKNKSKSKSKSCGPGTKVDFEERKRRSSISHFSSSTTTTSHNNNRDDHRDYSASGFRTPQPYADTPTKSYKEFSNLSDHHQRQVRNAAILPEKAISRNGSTLGFDQDRRLMKDHRDLRKLISDADDDDDGGADSDSSSDLFDLPNHELDFYCSSDDLPVYETTHVDRINIAKPISRATTV